MITVYVSHKFVEEFQFRVDEADEVIYDFHRNFIKKIRGAEIIVESDYNLIKLLINESEFYNDLSEISGIICDNSWISKLEDKTFLYHGSLSKVFLLGNHVDCDLLVSKYNLLFINNRNLKHLWSQVRTDRQVSEMTPSNSNENEFSFDNWSKLTTFKHPFHDMLIFDLYLLGDKSNQKINDNLKPMLTVFKSFTGSEKYELTIFSKEILKPRNANDPVEKIEEVYQRIEKEDCKLIYYDDSKALLREHDRQIITNYMVFDCGAGWNIFKEKGGVNTSTKIIGRSIFRNDTKNTAFKTLSNIKNYYSSVRDTKLKVPLSGQFDENNKLKFIEKDYHFPINFHPNVLEN